MLVVEELAKHPDWDFELIRIKDLQLPFCLGCFNCILKDEIKCPHRDTKPNITKDAGC
jgi:multimeric flavodoxin WrbA